MHIFLCQLSLRPVAINPTLFSLVLQACVRLLSENYIKLVMFKITQKLLHCPVLYMYFLQIYSECCNVKF